MRVLATVIGITIAAVVVATFAAAEPDDAMQETATRSAAQTQPAAAESSGMHMAAAVAGLTAVILLAPMTGRN